MKKKKKRRKCDHVINKTCCVWEAWISFSFPSVEPCLDSEHQQEMSPEKLLPSRPSLCLSKPPVSPSPSYSKSFEVDSGLCQGIFLTAFLIITNLSSKSTPKDILRIVNYTGAEHLN